MDSRGRLFVGDRGNNRIKIFDQDGKLLDTWYQFSRPSGIWIDEGRHLRRRLGVGLGRTRRTRLEARHPHRQCEGRNGALLHPRPRREPTEHELRGRNRGGQGGVIYGAEVGQKDLKRYVKK